jgi:hypothetical protein
MISGTRNPPGREALGVRIPRPSPTYATACAVAPATTVRMLWAQRDDGAVAVDVDQRRDRGSPRRQAVRYAKRTRSWRYSGNAVTTEAGSPRSSISHHTFDEVTPRRIVSRRSASTCVGLTEIVVLAHLGGMARAHQCPTPPEPSTTRSQARVDCLAIGAWRLPS